MAFPEDLSFEVQNHVFNKILNKIVGMETGLESRIVIKQANWLGVEDRDVVHIKVRLDRASQSQLAWFWLKPGS